MEIEVYTEKTCPTVSLENFCQCRDDYHYIPCAVLDRFNDTKLPVYYIRHCCGVRIIDDPELFIEKFKTLLDSNRE